MIDTKNTITRLIIVVIIAIAAISNSQAQNKRNMTSNMLSDYGESQLIKGFRHVELNSEISNTLVVNNQNPYAIFIELLGECNGVYINNKTVKGFDVVEKKKGKSDIKFRWFTAINSSGADMEFIDKDKDGFPGGNEFVDTLTAK